MIPPGAAGDVVLVDTTRHLTAVRVNPGSPPSVTAQTEPTMESLLTTLRASRYGLAAAPAAGDLSLGGVLAVGAHDTAVPANGERPAAGHGFGSLSNLVVALTASSGIPPRARTCCQKALAEAEQKVKLLTQEQGEHKLTPFEREDNDADS